MIQARLKDKSYADVVENFGQGVRIVWAWEIHYSLFALYDMYRKVSNIRRTKCHNLNDSRLVLQLSVSNPLKPSVKSIMKM